MKLNSKKIAVLLTVVMLIVFIVLAFILKGKKRKQFDELIGKIDREPKGCTGLGFDNVTADTYFDPQHFAYMIYSAKGAWLNDDEEQVKAALNYKTKPQIKAIDEYFQQKYGYTIIGYLETFSNEDEMKQYKTIIENAA